MNTADPASPILANMKDINPRLPAVEMTRFRTILVAALAMLGIGLYVLADRLALITEQNALQRLARSHADLIISFRNFYSSNLLPIVRQHSELTISHDYKNIPGTLPIPATMTLDLIGEIAKLYPEMNLRLVSPYPFPWRTVALDRFETDAMNALQASGTNEFHRLENGPQGKVLRYAAPIRLEASCIGCHNGHPDSPKRNWKVGDVRGIQVMSLPITGLTYNAHPQYYLLATLLLLVFSAAGFSLNALYYRGARALQLAQANAVGLRDRQHALDAHAIVSITDQAGRIVYANEQFCAISGYRHEELQGQFHSILKSGVHPEAFYAEMWQTISSGDVWQGEICNRNKQGDLYWVKSTIFPFLDDHGKPFQYIAIRTDITDRKAVEAELIAKRGEAEAASRAKSEFLANMSHEIRTPMNGIIGMTDLALDAVTESERQEYLKIVKNSAESLLGILNDILDFSKIEAKKLMLEQVGFALRRVISETLKTMAPRATQKGLELICDIADEVPAHVIGDPTRLRQVLINLVGNAIKFTATGEIVVNLAVEARTDRMVTLQVSVRDSGIGISPDKLDSIFEAFAQADASTTRQYGGTGLGLSISSRLVELMGGHMTVVSEAGQGTTFQFTVVLAVDPRPVAPLETRQLAGRCVLVVDDHATNREIFMRQLKRWGMRALLATSGSEAQALCSQPDVHPDLVVLDQHMPGMDGLHLAEWLRTQSRFQATPLLMLSSGPLKDDADRVRAVGLSGYMTKPVIDTEFLAAMQRALGIEQEAPPSSQPAGPAAAATRALSVLLVEDNAINQQLATRLLEKWGNQVTLAGHGQEAIDRLARGERFDLVLMDMQMPVMGGVEATRLIRAREAEHGLPRLPIVAMTANAMQGDREICLAAGMDDYLSKPISQVELAAKLQGFSPAISGISSGANPGTAAEAVVMVPDNIAVPPAPTFDYAAALARMDAEIVEILGPAFLEHAPHELASLRHALATGDAAEALRRAHGLKGTLAAFGAQPAEWRAAEIEALAKTGDLANAQSRVLDLERQIALLTAVLSP